LDNPEQIIDCNGWCQTEFLEWQSTPYTFVWTIKNFSSRSAWGSDALDSNIFYVQVPNSKELTTKWFLRLESDNSNFWSLHIHNYTGTEVKAAYKFSILDSKKVRQNIMHSNGVALFSSSYSSKSGFKTFVHRSLTGDFLPKDCLHIVCDLTVIGAQIKVTGKKKIDTVDTQIKQDIDSDQRLSELSHDLEEAFLKNEASDSDVVIKCSNSVFRCHKFILKARSPVFDAMFKADMKESSTGVVTIDNLDPKVVTSMLYFIYTGKIPNIDEIAKDLLAAANQYQIEKLKRSCEEKLCQSLESNNCLEFLILAQVYSSPFLKKCSLEMAAKNLVALVETNEWKEDLSDHPTLKDEVIKTALSLKNDAKVDNEKKRSAVS